MYILKLSSHGFHFFMLANIGRVLEASLADAKPSRGSGILADINPYERTRSDSWPIGLKNIGNTCWFNAVVQVCTM